MKKITESAAYESPSAQVVLMQVEGLLCQSGEGASHDGFLNGGDINFGDIN